MENVSLLGPAKGRILRDLQGHGKTALEVASKLDIQVSAARKHLERLKTLGLVREEYQQIGMGRPKKFYALTDRGKELFPRNYDAVLNAAVSKVAQNNGPEYAESIMKQIAGDIAKNSNPTLARSPKRMQQLMNTLNELGFEAQHGKYNGRSIITSRNCPLLKTAREHKELVCRGLHAEIIRATLGVKNVDRDKWIINGDSVCTHLV